MKIVVTGASGNVGTALLRRFLNDTHEIVAIARRIPAPVDAYAHATWLSIDLADVDVEPKLIKAFDGADAIVHLAWMIQSVRQKDLMWRTNVRGTTMVANAAIAAQVPHLVHMSSLAAYSPAPHDRLIDESWPVTGIPSSVYSKQKAAVERNLDSYERSVALARLRPPVIAQRGSASAISRYFLGDLVPSWLFSRTVLRYAPWPAGLSLQIMHSDDVADAVIRVLERRATGPFNLTSEPVIDRDTVKEVMGGLGPNVPPSLARLALLASWRLHLQRTDPSWLDLAREAPLMQSDRARQELDWHPVHDARDTLQEFLDAIAHREGASGPVLHP